MDEAAKRRWDSWMSVVPPVLTAVGILVGVWQFNEGADQRRRADADARVAQSRIEFDRRLWLDKVEAYRQVAQLAGRIVSDPPGSRRDEAIRAFTAAYWSTMILAGDDRDVERAMIAFNADLRDLRTGWTGGTDRLKVRADALMRAFRTSIEADRPRTPSVP